MSKIMHVVELPKGEQLTKELLEEAMSYLPKGKPEDFTLTRLLRGDGISMSYWNYVGVKRGVLMRFEELRHVAGPKLIVKVIEAI